MHLIHERRCFLGPYDQEIFIICVVRLMLFCTKVTFNVTVYPFKNVVSMTIVEWNILISKSTTGGKCFKDFFEKERWH